MNDSTPASLQPRGTFSFGGRTVSRIGFGAMQLPRLHDDRDAAIRLVRRAAELGVDHIDTALYYGHGFSNEILREALAGQDDVMIVSKVGWAPESSGPLPIRLAQRPEELRASVEDNLRTLGLEQIPVVNLRRIDARPLIPVPDGQVVDVDDQLAEMTTMRDEGIIGGIGLSTVDAEVLSRALPIGIACVQNAYSLVDRSDEGLLALCVEHDIAWVPYFPLGSAFPDFPKVTDETDVQAIAAELGFSPTQVGLAWLLHHTPNTLLIPGTASIDHLESNLATGDVRLTDAMTALLDAIPTRIPDQH